MERSLVNISITRLNKNIEFNEDINTETFKKFCRKYLVEINRTVKILQKNHCNKFFAIVKEYNIIIFEDYIDKSLKKNLKFLRKY